MGQQQTGTKFRRGIYSVRVVVWLMILQPPVCGGSLSMAVQWLIQGAATSPAAREPIARHDRIILDGSSLELEHYVSLVARYPPAVNQFGRSHWPILRIVVAHDLETGLALAPCWGPM